MAMTYRQIHGMDALQLVCANGSHATILLQGAQLLSWQPAGHAEQLFTSPRSNFVSGTPVRGGVPVVFPQFDDCGPLQKHGFARTRLWQVAATEQPARQAVAELRLIDDALTRSVWPHQFELQLRVQIGPTQLDLELTCHNRGATAFDFTCALHTYLRLRNLGSALLHGLQHRPYYDKVARSEQLDKDEALAPLGEIDRVYPGVVHPLSLSERDGLNERTLTIEQQGFEDVVVWNPGAERCATLADMTAQGYQEMLCVEAAAVARPVHLHPQQHWRGSQRFTVA